MTPEQGTQHDDECAGCASGSHCDGTPTFMQAQRATRGRRRRGAPAALSLALPWPSQAHALNWNSSAEELGPLLHSLIYQLLPSIRVDVQASRLLHGSTSSPGLLHAGAQTGPALAPGAPAGAASVPLMAPHLFLCTSLRAGSTRYSRAILYLPCASPGISHFYKQPWRFTGDWSLETKTSARCVHYC